MSSPTPVSPPRSESPARSDKSVSCSSRGAAKACTSKKKPANPDGSALSVVLRHALLGVIFCVQYRLLPTGQLIDTGLRIYHEMDWSQFVIDITHPTAPLGFTLLYLVMMKFAQPASEEFVTGTLKPFLKKYNLAMSLFSLACTIAMAAAMWQVSPLWTNDCERAFNNRLFAGVQWVFYYSKFVEYIDSWSLHAAGKTVSWLQFLHHMGAPWMMWYGCHYESEGGWIPTLLNSFVHFVMYGYYYAATCGHRLRCKPLITVMQITQFVSAFFMAWPYHSLPCMQEPRHAGKALALAFCYFYVAMVLFLFINFSLCNYIFKPARQLAHGAAHIVALDLAGGGGAAARRHVARRGSTKRCA